MLRSLVGSEMCIRDRYDDVQARRLRRRHLMWIWAMTKKVLCSSPGACGAGSIIKDVHGLRAPQRRRRDGADLNWGLCSISAGGRCTARRLSATVCDTCTLPRACVWSTVTCTMTCTPTCTVTRTVLADSTDARLYAHVYYAVTPVPKDWKSYLK